MNHPFMPPPVDDRDLDEVEADMVEIAHRPRFRLDGYQTVRYQGRDWLRGDGEAQRFAGRGRTTVWDWRRRGIVRAVKVRERSGRVVWLYSPGSLRLAARNAVQRADAARGVAGPGRGQKHTPESLAAARERAAARRNQT